MAIKLNVRGRGKFRPMRTYTHSEVQSKLREIITQETSTGVFSNTTKSYVDNVHKATKGNVSVLSLFCGVGGLDLGFELACLDAEFGIDTVTSALNDKDIFSELRKRGSCTHLYANDFFKEALEVYSKRIPCKTIENKDIRKVEAFPLGADIILGGFPCPGFSLGGPRLIDDPRNFLYLHYIRALRQAKPKFFIAENVKGMLTLGNGEVFRQIKQDFESAGYNVYHKLVNAANFGVPQHRHRVFLIGIRHDLEVSVCKDSLFPSETHGGGKLPYRTLNDAIRDLETAPGRFYEGSFSPMYMSRNRKKSWEEPSFTIQASGRQAPLHPSGLPMIKDTSTKDKWQFAQKGRERRLSVKEIARIQTFPDWWFEELDNSHSNSDVDKAYKQIGNAVPVELARCIARPIAQVLLNLK